MVMDPALNLKYKCQNIFTHKLEWMQEEHYKQDYGFLTCPGEKCETKLGIFSYEGIRCQSCLTQIMPAFQFFRKNLEAKRIETKIQTRFDAYNESLSKISEEPSKRI